MATPTAVNRIEGHTLGPYVGDFSDKNHTPTGANFGDRRGMKHQVI